MDTVIAAPASCEVPAVIRFLHAEGQSAAEIHRRLCRVYGDNVNIVTTERELWRYDNAFIFTNQSEVDFGITLVYMYVCNAYVYTQYTYISIQYIYLFMMQ